MGARAQPGLCLHSVLAAGTCAPWLVMQQWTPRKVETGPLACKWQQGQAHLCLLTWVASHLVSGVPAVLLT